MSLIRGLKPGMIIDKAKVFLIGKDGEVKFDKPHRSVSIV